jgi:hypothetical protein
MEQPTRASIVETEIYVCYNALFMYLIIGRVAEPDFVEELFEVRDIRKIDYQRGEDVMFSPERLSC